MATISSDELFQKVRINFLFNHPFLSVLALSIDTSYTKNKKSAFETDGFKIDIDLEKLSHYSDDELTYLYAHTLWHKVLKHPYRRKIRDKYIWNQACDIVTNNILSSFKNIGIMPSDELFDEDLWCEPVERYGVVTAREPVIDNSDIAATLKVLETMTTAVLVDGKFPFVFGGEHSITPGAIRPFLKKYDDLIILHFDAHADLRDGYEDEHFSHAAAIRRVCPCRCRCRFRRKCRPFRRTATSHC